MIPIFKIREIVVRETTFGKSSDLLGQAAAYTSRFDRHHEDADTLGLPQQQPQDERLTIILQKSLSMQ